MITITLAFKSVSELLVWSSAASSAGLSLPMVEEDGTSIVTVATAKSSKSKESAKPFSHKKWKHYTEEDKAYIREHYGKKKTSAIARELGRTAASIENYIYYKIKRADVQKEKEPSEKQEVVYRTSPTVFTKE